jgi:hypothetical protein
MLQPETGQTTPFTGSFNHCVEQTMMLRQANPFLAERHGWRLDRAGVEHDVEQHNVARMISGGWLDFIVMDDGPPAPTYVMPPPAQKKTSVVGKLRNVAAGVGVLLDWIGPTAKAVPAELSERRAAICVSCPMNGKGGVLDFFTAEAAKTIHTQLQMRTELELKTSIDEQLGICQACSCWLPLKVHVPIEFILAHTSDEVRTKLDPRCWVLAGT